uniref:hypothetical protein n=1 Tax=Helicobacter ganmani TaxID=60246 RepID=UPI003A87F7B2
VFFNEIGYHFNGAVFPGVFHNFNGFNCPGINRSVKINERFYELEGPEQPVNEIFLKILISSKK